MPREHMIRTSDGVRLHMREDGRADCPALLFCNGLGTDLHLWDRQIDTLAPGFRIVRFDIRGHGLSDVPPGDYSIDRLGRDVLDIADALGCERFSVCGLSLGAMTGYWLAINAPDRLERFVAANGAPFAGGPAPWTARMAQVEREGVAPMAETIVPRWFTADFAAAHRDTVDASRRVLLATSVTGYLGGCAAIRDLDLRSGLTGIMTPTLLIGGKHDQTPFPAVIEGLAATIPSARAVILDTAHLSNVADPDGFNRAVASFLS